MSKSPEFTWNVWNWSFNHDDLETYDVGYRFVLAVDQARPGELPTTLEELDGFLLSEARYCFWAKCEYEMIVTGWPQQKNERKVDIYGQLRLNWDRFVSAFWDEVYEPYYLKKAIKARKAMQERKLKLEARRAVSTKKRKTK